MSKSILTNYDFNLNEIQNVKAHLLAVDPGAPVEAQFWWNSVTKTLKYYDGTTIKTLADLGAVTGLLSFQGGYDATTNTPNLTTPASGAVKKGYTYIVTVLGTFFTETLGVGDMLVAQQNDPSAVGHWVIVQNNLDQASETVKGIAKIATQVVTDAGTNNTDFITALKLETWRTNKNIAKHFQQTGVSIGTTPGTQTITHNLNTRSVIIAVHDETTFAEYGVTVVHATLNTVTISANGATKTVTVTVIGK